MSIPLIHKPLFVEGETHSLGHLDAKGYDMVGKSKDGCDLRVVLRFSTHVFSDRATHGQRRDLQDHSGTWRTFCPDRYAVSLLLPQVMKNFVVADGHAGISQDFNKGSNLILIEPVEGESWAVFFCFEPSPPGVLLTVLSVYAKTGNMYASKKFNRASYYARKCLFSNERVP
ncbi:hypothetical protein [Sulfitobacter sp. R86518]|uniref:hypothetical protein n=1 Tax=Sulfitobacter sp. R86518 TaxID=3093858 RepID=UPI0036DEAF50